MSNPNRKFLPGVAANLGEYVYALRDPRDNKVFYIGKGTDDRVFAHFDEADSAQANNFAWTAKLRRIVEIWEASLDVEWWIVRHNLQTLPSSPVDSFDVEAALIDILEISKNGPALNDIAGHRKATRGMLSEETVDALATSPVGPTSPFQRVFIFPIQKALDKGINVYDATRRLWAVSSAFRAPPPPALAIGIGNGVSKGVFDNVNWTKDPTSGKWEFTGNDITINHQLANKSWATVIGAAMGYWQRGNYLIIEFNGTGQYRFLRGSANRGWQSL